MKKHSKLKKIIQSLFLLFVIVFFIKFFINNLNKIKNFNWEFNVIYFIFAFFLLIIFDLITSGIWSLILNKLGYNIPLIKLMNIWLKSQLGKYIPGKIWMYLSRIHLSKKKKAKKIDVISSSIIELIYVGCTSLIFGIFILLILDVGVPKIFIILFCILIIAAFVIFLVIPEFVNRIAALFRVKYRIFPSNDVFSIKYKMYLFLLSLLSWLVVGVGFFFLVKAFYSGLNYSYMPMLVSAFAISWLIGLVSVIAPAGAGVREGVLSLILSSIMPLEIAVVMAVLSRIWWSIVELIVIIVFSIIGK